MYESDDEFFGEDVKRPSKAAERRGWRSAVQEELDELGDLYGVEANILRGISYVKQSYGCPEGCKDPDDPRLCDSCRKRTAAKPGVRL